MWGSTKISALVLIVFAAVVNIAAQKVPYTENKNQHDGHTVLLGGLFPLSNNDNNRCQGIRTSAVEASEAMVFAIRSINANPTLLPNVNLTFDIRDTCSIPNKALEQSLSYVHSSVPSRNINESLAVSGIIGAGFFSHVSAAVASLFRLFQIPQISYGSSASVLSDRVRFDYFFRTLPPDSFLARAMADVVNHFNWTYVIALHSDDTFGNSGMEIILKKIIERNNSTTCVAVQISLPIVESDAFYDNVVARMNRKWVRNATVAMLYGYRSQATAIMQAIQRLVEREPDSPLQYLTWVGCEALRVSSEYHHLVQGMMRMEYRVKGSHSFQNHFTSMTPNRASGNPHFNEYWETKFNCSIAQGQGRQRCPSNLQNDNYKQKNEISSIIDAVYAFAHAIHALIVEHCPNGDLCSKIVVQHTSGIGVNGTMIRDYLLYNLSFPGLSADVVRFDSSGNDRSSYYVKNLQKRPGNTYEYEIVGTWDPVNLLNLTGDIHWNNRDEVPTSVCSLPCENGSYPESVDNQAKCCWTCKQCLGDNTVSTGQGCSECVVGYSPNENRSKCIKNPISHLKWTDPWVIVIVIATCLGIAATTFVVVVYIVCFKHTIIKASSRELSGILLGGLMLCYIVAFFFMAKPSEAICGIRRILVGMSFSVCFSALLVRTNRIHRIFNRSPEQMKTVPRFISPQSQVLITFILISIQAIITILWLSIEHPSIVLSHDRRVTELKCGESPTISLLVYLGYNLLLLILSTYFAFLARKVPENFNEAKFINITLYTIIIIWLALIPTYLGTAQLGSIYQTVSLVIAIILSATTTLGCLFMPKVFILFKQLIKREKDSQPTSTNGFTTNSNGFTTKSSLASNGSADNKNSLDPFK